MAFVRLLGNLLKDRKLRPRIVPIVADEARTFGTAHLFKQVGIYSFAGNDRFRAIQQKRRAAAQGRSAPASCQSSAARSGRLPRRTGVSANARGLPF